MTVFKGYCILLKRNSKVLFVYLGIFLGIVIMIQMAYESDEGGSSFQPSALKMAIIDEDNSVLSNGLTAYMDEYHDLIEVVNDKRILQEEMYYGNIEYIMTIPKGYGAEYKRSSEQLTTTKVPGTYTSYYADQQIDTYLNGVLTYLTAGYTIDDAVDRMLDQSEQKADVKLLDKNGNGGQMPRYNNLFMYLPYLYIAVLCHAISTVMVAFRETEVKKRMFCSSVSTTKQNGQAIMALLIAGIGLWGFCMLLPVIMYTQEFLASANLYYYLLNSFVCMLVAMSLAFLVGVSIKNRQIVDNISNVLSLGLCFLGGVFVPKEMFGDSILKVAQFLPTFWYEEVNALLGEYVTLTQSLQADIWKGVGIQVIFAAACVCVALAVSKYQERY